MDADVWNDETRSARAQMTELERVGMPQIVGGVYRMGEAEDEYY